MHPPHTNSPFMRARITLHAEMIEIDSFGGRDRKRRKCGLPQFATASWTHLEFEERQRNAEWSLLSTGEAAIPLQLNPKRER
jgi:hypothetical protein